MQSMIPGFRAVGDDGSGRARRRPGRGTVAASRSRAGARGLSFDRRC